MVVQDKDTVDQLSPSTSHPQVSGTSTSDTSLIVVESYGYSCSSLTVNFQDKGQLQPWELVERSSRHQDLLPVLG